MGRLFCGVSGPCPCLPEARWSLHTPAVFDLETGVILFCVLLAVGFLGLWFYYDRRDHARFSAGRRRVTFHCIRCDHLYSSSESAETAPCPKCAYVNGRLRF